MGEDRAPYLTVVRDDGADGADGADDGAGEVVIDAAPAPAPVASAIMYAVMSWLALCVERVAVAVDIQPVAERIYEVSVHYELGDAADAEQRDGIVLRVRLDVEPGLVVRATVEPLRP